MSESTNDATTKGESTQTGDQATPAATGENSGKGVESIPKARFDAVNERAKTTAEALEAAQAELEQFRSQEQKRKDAEAAARGDVESAQRERDALKAVNDQMTEYVKQREADALEQLDEAGRGLIENLPSAVQGVERLKFIEGLVGFVGSAQNDQKEATSTRKPFGSSGGPGESGAATGMIPSDVTNIAEYHQWFANWSMTAEGRDIVTNREKMTALRAEKKRRFQQ